MKEQKFKVYDVRPMFCTAFEVEISVNKILADGWKIVQHEMTLEKICILFEK